MKFDHDIHKPGLLFKFINRPSPVRTKPNLILKKTLPIFIKFIHMICNVNAKMVFDYEYHRPSLDRSGVDRT